MTWHNRLNWEFRVIEGSMDLLMFMGLIYVAQGVLLALQSSDASIPKIFLQALFNLGLVSCCIIGFWYGLIGLQQWRESRRLMGGIPFHTRKVMSVLCRISQANRLVEGSKALMFCVGIIGLLAALLLKESRWLVLHKFSFAEYPI